MKVLAMTAALGLASTVAAHGGVGKYKLGGVEYVGYSPYNGGTQSTIQRPYASFDPILTPTGNNIRCNNNGQNTALTATVAAGSEVVAYWTQWTHAEGPVTVYMAKCPGACSGFDGSGKVWFKIDEAGLLSGTVNKGVWGNTIVLDTLKWTSTIPASLAPGNYLIRHEVLALHQANTPQFYPECAQLTITGSGTASPSGDFLVSLPGAFTMSDPGVMIDIYTSTATTYKVPGPAVWPSGSGGGGSTPPPASTSKPASASTTSKPASTSTSTTTSKAASTTAAASGTVAKYGQCGGIGYTGATGCISSTCTVVNDYYYQCL